MRLLRKFTGVIFVAMLLIVGLIAPATATDDGDLPTCQGDEAPVDVYDGGEKVGSLTWDDPGTGQVTFTADAGFEGYQVELCINGSTDVFYDTLADGEYSRAAQTSSGQNAGVSNVEILNVIPPDVDNGDVNYCDPSQRPDGMSIADWLPADFDPADCFTVVTDATVCGTFTATVTGPDVGGKDYRFRWVEGSAKAASPDSADDNAMPATFVEDYSGGSVDITYYIVGPEKDYFVGFNDAFPNWWDGGKTVAVDTDCVDDVVVDFCDPAQRPAGMSIDEWLTQAEDASEGTFDRSDCFEIEPVLQCGSFDAMVTGPYEGYEMVYLDGADQTTSLEWKELPAVFGEDAGGGSVDITVYLVGPEKDYLVGTGLPNYWEDTGRNVTIDTDCDTPQDVTITTRRTPEPVTYDITFLKDWAGDVDGGNLGTTIVTGEVTVEFTVEVNGVEHDDMFAPGDVLEVNEGDDVAITGETLSDLGDDRCSSTTALPDGLIDVSSDATLTVINSVDCADVQGIIVEFPEEPEAEPVDTPVDTKVLAEVLEGQTLPRSGASAVLLTLMGLLSVGLGGGMIKMRKRT